MKKKGIRITSAVMTACMVMMGVAGCGNAAQTGSNVVKGSESDSDDSLDSEEELTEAITGGLGVSEVESGKDETVYVYVDNAGTVSKITVNDVIRNSENGNIEDVSCLSDIENIKGDETYTQEDGKLVWNSTGNTITYQGTSDKELPVDMKITYTLDGKEVSADELAGASGHVTIKYEYINNTATSKVVDKAKREVVVPFVVASGMVLPSDRCANITIDNGKVLDEGSNSIVVGYAMPGVMECIREQVNDEEGILDKVEIPDSFTVEADVVDFEQDMSLTVMLPNVLGDKDKEAVDTSNITDKLDELDDSTGELLSASDKLDNGIGELKDGTGKLKEGTDTLKAGTNELKDGTSTAKDGSGKLVKGSKDLKDGAKELKDGVKKLKDGAATAAEGSETIKTNLKTLSDGAASAETGAKQLSDGLTSLKDSCDTLNTAAGTASTGMTDVANGIKTVDDSLDTLNTAMSDETSGLVSGAAAVATGATSAKAGVDELVTTLTQAPASITASVDAIMADVTKLTGITTVKELSDIVNDVNAAIAGYESSVPVATVLSNATGGKITSYEVYNRLVQANYSITALNQVADSMSAMIEGKADDVKKLKQGMADLEAGAGKVSEGVGTVYASTTKIAEGTEALVTGSATLDSGLSTMSTSIGQLVTGVDKLKSGASTLYSGNTSISSGASKLYTGMVSLDSGIDTLSSGIGELYTGTGTLYSGAGTLSAGLISLDKGILKLDNGASKLDFGVGDLKKGVKTLDKGAGKLKDGSEEFCEGINKFSEEGISKLTSLVRDDLAGAADVVGAILEEGKSYKNYSGISDDMDGTVKFIYKTEGIKADDAE